MMRLFLNCLAASVGGGVTYLRNVVPHLSARTDVETFVAAPRSLRNDVGKWPRVSWVEFDPAPNAGLRFYQEQRHLPKLVRERGADVLVSAGNFALRKSPVPQILLSGNSLYTSADFSRDLWSRREYKMLLVTRLKGMLARRSIEWADRTAAPSEAFAEDLRQWAGGRVEVIYHGFDRESFFANGTPLPLAVQSKLDSPGDAVRLLFVSHYNYYRNFETLLRALPLVRERLGRRVTLFLTCSLCRDANPGSYRAESAAALVRKLGLEDQVCELGPIPYRLLHQLYRICDVYVTAAYAETFAHPLVEAMASGIPIVASDLPVHREICSEAAVYFSRFSPEDLADRVVGLLRLSSLRERLVEAGKTRAREFSWRMHVGQLVGLAAQLAGTKQSLAA